MERVSIGGDREHLPIGLLFPHFRAIEEHIVEQHRIILALEKRNERLTEALRYLVGDAEPVFEQGACEEADSIMNARAALAEEADA